MVRCGCHDDAYDREGPDCPCRHRGNRRSCGRSRSAGGIGDFLSPAFGTSCANRDTGTHAEGLTSDGTGTAGGNFLGLPVGSPLNHCGDAAGLEEQIVTADLRALYPV
ncbi:chaplin family protein [Streptomyces lavendofoliae]|uniref:Chaplin domain-containing protein n=1 Tax=Streptomyces lavendofoliae TaxID=67314 RepID=A0A918I635_9ACTN|nr:hypothetical protein GCM10010274_65380 [Streptomyces lavendofoliae]